MRIPEFDYATPGAYYFTIVTEGRRHLFGDVVDDEMRLNEVGREVLNTWLGLPARFSAIELDELIVMPNHVHGILWLTGDGALHGRGAASSAPTLGVVMRAFKSVSARAVNARLGRTGRLWQRGYYERVIRSDRELAEIRQYVVDNPAKWAFDREYALEAAT